MSHMNKLLQRALFFVPIALCAGFFYGAVPVSRPSKKIAIMTSVFPLQEFARSVAGDRGEVSLILPPGAGVHNWQPRPSDIMRLIASDLFIHIGADLEPWAGDILRSASGKKPRILEVCRFVNLASSHPEDAHSDEEHGEHDPHIWLDFENDIIIVDRISAVLCEIDPDGSPEFRRNADLYIAELKTLDQEFRKGLETCRSRTLLLAGHAAFGYLARRYGLEQVSLYGLSPDAEPKPSQVIKAVELAKRENIKTIFSESNVSPKLSRVIAREIGAETAVLNPGHNLTREQMMSGTTFFDIMRENLERLKKGLGCGK